MSPYLERNRGSMRCHETPVCTVLWNREDLFLRTSLTALGAAWRVAFVACLAEVGTVQAESAGQIE